ncbi:MAG: nucleoside triphosphate pyrophosphohydrolase [Candidatus Dormibacteraeota bacterium]|nr:nucleoside triphosphate pyrophosphohydrolase [Candidatus Dormibacteraeota bacterium]
MPEHSKPYPDGEGAIFEVARRLRAPGGCPWDQEQTHESLRPYLLEETYELLEVIDRGQGDGQDGGGIDDGKMLEELGDVLLQVAMHSAIAQEQGRFDAARVSEAAAAKMVARHPHVFGDEEVADAEHVLRNWEQRKVDEAARAGRVDETPLDRVPVALPALAWTNGMQKRAARVGFDFEGPADAARAVSEEAQELAEASAGVDPQRVFDEVGDLLLAVVSLSRKLKVNPEDALRAAGHRFRDRFAAMDRDARARGLSYRDLAPEQLADLWERARS